MAKGFDVVAPFYDKLAFLFFGNTLKKAQTTFLSCIPKQANVLIIGGGTGWIATKVMEVANPQSICYLEVSAKMLTLAQAHWHKYFPHKSSHISFICQSENYLLDRELYFDVIITPFVLDIYKGEELEHMCQLLYTKLVKDGYWLFTDFHLAGFPQNIWAYPLIRSMYIFFQLTCGIRPSTLPDFEGTFNLIGLTCEEKRLYYVKCVQAVLLRKY